MNGLPFLILGVGAAWVGLMVAMRNRPVTSRLRAMLHRVARLDERYDDLNAIEREQHRRIVEHFAYNGETIGQFTRKVGPLGEAFKYAGLSAAEASEAVRRFNEAWKRRPPTIAGPQGKLP